MGLSIIDIFPALGQYVARNRAAMAQTALGNQPDEVQRLLGAGPASTMGTDAGGLTSGISTPGSGLMANPMDFQNQAQFATGLMGLPAYQGAGQQYMGQAMANQMGLPMELLRAQQQQSQSDRSFQETVRKNNMGTSAQQMIEFATNPMTDPVQAEMMKAYLKKSDGVTVNLPGQHERSNAAWASEAMQSAQAIDQILDSGYVPTQMDQTLSEVPVFGNHMVSPEYRQYRTASGAWIQANLRPESGATIKAEEEQGYFKTYFPQPGDDEATIEQKRLFRAQKLQSRITNAGRADIAPPVQAVPGAVPDAPQAPQGATASGNPQPPASAKPVSTKKAKPGTGGLFGRATADELKLLAGGD